MTTACNLATRRRRAAHSFAAPRALALALALTTIAGRADAQRVAPRPLDPAEDATVLQPGVFRLRVAVDWAHFNELYGAGLPGGSASGTLAPLGARFTADTLGVRQFPNLTPVQDAIRQLSGNNAFGLSLGNPRASMEGTIVTVPIMLEVGILSRLTLGVNVPYVRTRTDVVYDPNPRPGTGNVGLNPAITTAAARDQNGALVQQLTTATTRLRAALDACAADPNSSGCLPQVRADRAAAQALLNSTTAFTQGVTQVYGAGAAAGSPFVPIAGSAVQTAIEGRLTSFNTQFKTALGESTDVITGKPTAAPAQVALGDMQQFLTDPAFGIASDSLASVELGYFGDIEVGAKLLLLDTFRHGGASRTRSSGLQLRTAVSTIVRLPTGRHPSADNFFDIGTGTGATAVELRSTTDLQFGRRVWLTGAGRYGIQLADKPVLRIPASPSQPFPELFRREQVDRNLGDYVELQLAPRLRINNYVALSAQYDYRHKAQDRYTGSFAVTDLAGQPVTLDAGTLGQGTTQSEQRVGGGIAYSTIDAYERGVARFPLEVWLFHSQSVSGSGNLPKLFSTQIQLRYYTRPFGGGGSRRVR